MWNYLFLNRFCRLVAFGGCWLSLAFGGFCGEGDVKGCFVKWYFLFLVVRWLLWLLASVAFCFCGFCGFWLWWLLWLLASVAFVASGFCGFWGAQRPSPHPLPLCFTSADISIKMPPLSKSLLFMTYLYIEISIEFYV